MRRDENPSKKAAWLSRVIASLSSLSPGFPLSLSLLAFTLLSLPAIVNESCTFDEDSHLCSAYVAMSVGDYRFDPQSGVLGRRLSALPLLLLNDVKLPTAPLEWQSAEFKGYAFQFLNQCGNNSYQMLLFARLACLFWGYLIIGTTYAAARDAFGPLAGIVSLTLITFNPTLLAHAHLATVDTGAAALMLLSIIAFRRWFLKPTLINAMACGILAGAAIVSKFSALVLIPIFGLIAWLETRNIVPVRNDHAFQSIWGRRCLGLVLSIGIAYFTIWGLYGFRFSITLDPSFQPITYGITSRVFDGQPISFLRKHHIFPETLLLGYSEFKAHVEGGHRAFAFGHYSQTGWWWYFPLVLLIKSPISSIILTLAGVVVWAKEPRPQRQATRYILFSAAILLVLPMLSTVNIGVRHLLPLIPFMAIIAGSVGRKLEALESFSFPQKAICGLIITVAVEASVACPYYLPYFNVVANLFKDRHEMLACSNVDWGQDLGRLKKYMDRYGIPKVHLSFYGTASPRALGLDHEVLPGFNPYTHYESEWKQTERLNKGDIVAVSATNLAGVYLHEPQYFKNLLQSQRPFASIGHSILLYRVPE